MHVKLLTNLGSNDFPETPFRDGETHEVGDALGAKLVGLRLAIDVTPPPAPRPIAKEPEPKHEPTPEPAPKADKFSEMRVKHQPHPKSETPK